MFIKQGRMMVIEYVTKFNELARLAPTMVPINDAQIWNFMIGLMVEVPK